MSTKFTTNARVQPTPLTVLLGAASQIVLRQLRDRLRDCGFETVTEPHLVLFGNLDCGATHAAQIALRMQVSRQAISKTLRELQTLGFLTLQDDPSRGNQKLVVMTARGQDLAIEARQQLQAIEADMAASIGINAVSALRDALDRYWNACSPTIPKGAPGETTHD